MMFGRIRFLLIVGVILLIGGALLLGYYYLGRVSIIPSGSQAPGNSQNAAVAPPTRINIPAIGVAADMTNLGLNADHTLEVPKNPEQVGWYVNSPPPGAVGPAILVGHLDSKFGPAIFFRLHELKAGDQVEISRADGSVAVFQVEKLEKYSQTSFPTDQVYGTLNYPGLRLITCTGSYSKLLGHYSDNLIVYARLVQTRPA